MAMRSMFEISRLRQLLVEPCVQPVSLFEIGLGVIPAQQSQTAKPSPITGVQHGTQ